MYSRKSIAVLFALMCLPRVTATSIPVIVRTNRIVIATDAMSMITKSYGYKRIKICKIYRTGNTFIAFAGMDQDDTTGYVASRIAKENSTLSIRARAEQFRDRVQKPLLESFQSAYKGSPVKFRAYFPGNFALAALFAGIENDRAVFYVFNITRIEDANGYPVAINVEEHSCPGDSCPQPDIAKTIWLGESEAIRAEYPRMARSKDARLSDDVVTLKHLVEVEIAVHPDVVGPPIAVLTIDRNGGHWNVDGCCNQGKKKAEPESRAKPAAKP